MTRIVSLLLLIALLAPSAQAQVAPRGFPMNQSFKAISISDFDVQTMGLTLKVVKNPNGEGLRGLGHAGCNGWNATVMLRDDHIDFTKIITTRKFCGQERMKAENAFLTSLRSANRLRLDGKALVIEGDAARLLLKSAAINKKALAKPAKKRDKSPGSEK
jgi:hypothetical protein